jgi:hypothetical protein
MEIDGQQCRVWGFTITLGYSLRRWAQAATDQRLGTLLRFRLRIGKPLWRRAGGFNFGPGIRAIDERHCLDIAGQPSHYELRRSLACQTDGCSRPEFWQTSRA